MSIKKLSVRPTDDALNALIGIVEPAEQILKDGELWSALEGELKGKSKKDLSLVELALNSVSIYAKLINIALGKHRGAVYQILSVMTGKDIKDIEAQTLNTTLSEILEMKEDEDLINFFTSLLGRKKKS